MKSERELRGTYELPFALLDLQGLCEKVYRLAKTGMDALHILPRFSRYRYEHPFFADC
jgi:hypothetical protein